MHYFLAPFSGRGTQADPYRVPEQFQPRSGIVDLRPDPSKPDGLAFLACPDRVNKYTYLGEELKTPSAAVGAAFRQSRGSIAELLMKHLLGMPTPLQPSNGAYVVHIGSQKITLPVIRGGVTITETFNTANSSTLGPVTTWTEDAAYDWRVVSNQCVPVYTADSEGVAYPDTAMLTDHYVEAKMATTPASAWSWAVATRIEDVSNWYAFGMNNNTGADELLKRVAGSYTAFSGTAHTAVAGVVWKLDATGSTLTATRGGVGIYSQTDTSLTAGTFAGLRTFHSSTYVGEPAYDDVTVSDGVSTATLSFHHYYT